MPKPTPLPEIAYLVLDGYAGRSRQPVRVIGETETKLRIMVEQPTRLAGRNCWLMPGESRLVPKHAVRRREEPPR